MDYFVKELKKAGVELEARVNSLIRIAVETNARNLLDETIKKFRQAQKDAEIAEYELDHKKVVDKDISIIVASVLSKYHAHSEIEVKNDQFEEATELINHYGNLDLRVH